MGDIKSRIYTWMSLHVEERGKVDILFMRAISLMTIDNKTVLI